MPTHVHVHGVASSDSYKYWHVQMPLEAITVSLLTVDFY